MIHIFSDIIGTVLETAMLYSLQKSDKKIKWTAKIPFGILPVFIFFMTVRQFPVTIKIGFIFLYAAGAAKILFQTKVKRIIACNIIYLLAVSLGEIIGFALFRLLWNASIQEILLNPVQSFFLVVTTKLFMLIFVLYVRSFIVRAHKLLDKHLFFTLTPLMTCFIILFIESFRMFSAGDFTKTEYIFNIASIVSVVLSAFCIIVLIEKYLVTKSIEAANHLNIQQISSGYHYLSQKVESHEKIMELYHDLKNHLLILQTKNENTGYIDGLLEKISDYEYFADTGNAILNTILYEKYRLSNAYDIEFESYVNFSRISKLQDFDICAIFGNAIDNAIEACLKIPDGSLRKILIRADKIHNFLLIKIENSISGSMKINKNLLETTKAEQDLHGYGLKSISRSVQKYEGELEISLCKDLFRLNIAIPL